VKNCEKNYSMSEEEITILGDNQGGKGRHKCVICAYNYGLKDGRLDQEFSSLMSFETCKHGNQAPIERIKDIHSNQIGDQGRHKCLVCAYELGFNKGLESVKIEIIDNKRPSGKLSKQLPKASIKKPTKRDYLDEQRYKEVLGLMGEKVIYNYLKENGYKLKHVSLTDDSAGYDILATKNNKKKFIEVKTTTQNSDFDFFISKNEVEVMSKNLNNYFIYRVYKYNLKTNSAKFHIINTQGFKDNYTANCISFRVTKNT
jgi:Holliday junction resolvase-like predicted endonuclease/rubredoxin